MNKNILSLGLLLAGNAYGGALDAVAKAHNARIVWVEENTPLWQVASTLERDASKTVVADGYVNKNELIKTTLCDDWQLRGRISNLNNQIADLTAVVADVVELTDVAKAMRLDSQMVKLKDGTTCEVNPRYIVINQGDGLRGDGAVGLRSQSGYYPVAVPDRFFVKTLPASNPPASNPPALRNTEEDLINPYVVLGVHHIKENGKASLAGWGVDLEGLVETGHVVFRLADVRYDKLTYENGRDNVKVVSFDTGLGYLVRLGDKTGLVLGANVQGRFAGVDYAGVSAKTSDVSLGPEVDLVVRADKVDLTGRVSTSLVGNVKTDVDLDGYESTKDSMSRTSASLETGYDFGIVRLAGVLGLDNMNYSATTQDRASLTKGSTTYELDVNAQVALTENVYLEGGVSVLPYESNEGQDTNSTVYGIGLGANF